MNEILQRISIFYLIALSTILISDVCTRQHRQHHQKYSNPEYDNDLSLWIDEQQVKRFSGTIYILQLFHYGETNNFFYLNII